MSCDVLARFAMLGTGPRLRIFHYGGKPQRRRHSHTSENLPTPEILFLLVFGHFILKNADYNFF